MVMKRGRNQPGVELEREMEWNRWKAPRSDESRIQGGALIGSPRKWGRLTEPRRPQVSKPCDSPKGEVCLDAPGHRRSGPSLDASETWDSVLAVIHARQPPDSIRGPYPTGRPGQADGTGHPSPQAPRFLKLLSYHQPGGALTLCMVRPAQRPGIQPRKKVNLH